MIKKRLTSSDEESENDEEAVRKCVKIRRKRNSINILQKIINRQNTGFFNENITKKSNEYSFKHIPAELRFCLKDLIPFCYLNQFFIGLTLCGNFLISYKRLCIDNENYDLLNNAAGYELYFWIFEPHRPLNRYVSNKDNKIKQRFFFNK
jgi:hypothetical protein